MSLDELSRVEMATEEMATEEMSEVRNLRKSVFSRESVYFRKTFSCFKKIVEKSATRKSKPSSYIVFMFCKCTCSGLIDILIQAQVMILWGFLNTLMKFLSMVWVWMGGIIGRLIFKIEILKFGFFT